ncbi:hypothetical protein CHUAL_001515 [Chamberlinius hualienensis]
MKDGIILTRPIQSMALLEYIVLAGSEVMSEEETEICDSLDEYIPSDNVGSDSTNTEIWLMSLNLFWKQLKMLFNAQVLKRYLKVTMKKLIILFGSVTSKNLKTFNFLVMDPGVSAELHGDYYNKMPEDFYNLMINEDIIAMMVTETNLCKCTNFAVA